MKVDISKVMRVYSGKAHRCCCGCSGTYWVASSFRNQADANRGYPHDDSDVSDYNVRRVVKLINKTVDENGGPECEVEGDFVSVTVGARMYTAYFVK